MEGYVSLFTQEDTSNNRPHFRGFVKIGDVDHEFALWPSKSGKGFTGKYKPKEQKQAKAPAPVGDLLDD